MTEASREPELTDAENPDKTALNLTSTSRKVKPLPERGTWSTKLDFILSVVIFLDNNNSNIYYAAKNH